MFVSAALAGACQQPSGVPETTASAATTTTGAAQTTANASTTTGEPTTLGGGSSEGSSSETEGECPVLEDPTTGAINPQVVEECDALCAHYQECGLKEHALCQMGCVAKFGLDHQDCFEARSAARKCLMALACEELGEYLQFNEGGSCAQLLEDEHQACTCQTQSGMHSGGDACTYRLDCPYVPLRRMVCRQGTCECYVGDDVVKTCPQGDTCQDWLDLWDKAESCCCMVLGPK